MASLDDDRPIAMVVMTIPTAVPTAVAVSMLPTSVPAMVMMAVVPPIAVLDDNGFCIGECRSCESETCRSSEYVKNFLHIHSPVNHHVENADFGASVPTASQENSEQMFRNACGKGLSRINRLGMSSLVPFRMRFYKHRDRS
jgi:hypothetical protein